ncbi:hypothetical protein ACM66B_000144 [Microbotryomycetes sp. NB124-2]
MDDWLRQQQGLSAMSQHADGSSVFASGQLGGSPQHHPPPRQLSLATRDLLVSLAQEEAIQRAQSAPDGSGFSQAGGAPHAFDAGAQPIAIGNTSRLKHDTNSYEDSFPLEGSLYGTPSYAGSYDGSAHGPLAAGLSARQHDDFGSSSRHSHDTSNTAFDFVYKSAQDQQQPMQHLSFGSQFGNSDVLHHYRENAGLSPNYLNSGDDDSSSAYGGSHWTSSNAGSVIGAEDAMGLDFDLETMMLGNRSASASPAPFVDNGEQRQPERSPFLKRRLDANKTLMPSTTPDDGTQDSESRSPFMLESAITESPPTSSANLRPPSTRVNSPPTLAPLAIPSDGPSFNLIQPTPMTARPSDKQKGSSTLELERIMGLNEWQAKNVNTSFSEFTPTTNISHQSQLPLFPGRDKFTAAPESYDTSGVGPLSGRSVTPDLTVHVAERPPIRQRSRSEADIRSPTASNIEGSVFEAQLAAAQAQGQTNLPVFPTAGNVFPTPHPPQNIFTESMMQAASAWQHAAAGGFVPVQVPDAHTALALSDQIRTQQLRFLQLQQQHGMSFAAPGQEQPELSDLGTTLSSRPGYSNAGMDAALQLVEGHRRSRSQGHLHNLPQFTAHAPQFTSELGSMLAPSSQARSPSPAQSTSSRRSSFSETSQPFDSFADQLGIQSNAVPSFPTFPIDNNFNTFDVPPPPTHAPFVYHSPQPQSRQGSMSSIASAGSSSGISPRPAPAKSRRNQAPTRESKTTQATIDAAMRRRNPGSNAKFVCDLCGETFTRRYNLKGHLRAHRNEKPFECSYEGCGKAFARSHDCKRHELLHLNVRRYHCDPCKRDFVRLDALQRHHRSDVGQKCVDQLRAQGFAIPYDTVAPQVAL